MVVDLAQAMGPLKGTEGEPLEEQLDESLVRTVALSSAGGLSPMAAVLGAVKDYHKTQLQWSVWSKRQLAPSGDHLDGDCDNNAFLLLLVGFVTM